MTQFDKPIEHGDPIWKRLDKDYKKPKITLPKEVESILMAQLDPGSKATGVAKGARAILRKFVAGSDEWIEAYLKGIKEFNQNSVVADFRGTFTDTEGFFCDVDEYDEKKETAILSLTKDKEERKLAPKNQKIAYQRDTAMKYIYDHKKLAQGPLYTLYKFSDFLKDELKLGTIPRQTIQNWLKNAGKRPTTDL